MNILWLSWRDIQNPEAGGAEKVAIETASRLAREGHQITIFTSTFKNAKMHDVIRSVKIERRGNRLTCRLFAPLFYLKNRDFDMVIDEINTIPFFAHIWAKNKTVTLIHQLAREYWYTQTVWPLNILGFSLEPIYLKLFRKTSTIVISNSTKNDLKKLGFEKIKVIRVGLDFKPRVTDIKQDLILFIGRLKPVKGPQDAISAFRIIYAKLPQTKLCVVGQGESKFISALKKLVDTTKLKNNIIFTGFISDQQKINLLSKAKIILIPSVREGWNLVATEANATGCVPIAYNVPGLRDSIKNGRTGILVECDVQKLAQAAIDLLENDKKRLRLAQNGLKFAQNFSWDNTYESFKEALGGKFSKVSR